MHYLVALTLGLGLLQDVPKLSQSYLQGTWGDNLIENASFTIHGDSIYYLEDGLKGYKYEITQKNQLAVEFSYGIETTAIRILNEDSFSFLNEQGNPEATLYRLKED